MTTSPETNATSASPPSPLCLKAIALLLLLLLQLPSSSSSSKKNTHTPISSYQPTSGIEDKWVAEEEFHGASSWWDEDDDEYDDEHNDVERTPPSTSSGRREKGASSSSSSSKMKKKRHRLSLLRTRKKERRRRNGHHHDNIDTTETTMAKKNTEKSSMDHVDDESISSTTTTTKTTTILAQNDIYDEEHPMRTDEWKLDVRLSPWFRLSSASEWRRELFPECGFEEEEEDEKRRRRGGRGRGNNSNEGRKRQVMQFARNGYVKIVEGDTTTTTATTTTSSKKKKKPRVGKWRMGHSGVAFDIPMPIQRRVVERKGRKRGEEDENEDEEASSPRTMTVLHYHADIHLNKFGERPRMFRGVITRDRHSSFLPPNFLRPVIGTFSAEGIGRDTADTTYKERAISLSRQQAINDAKQIQQRGGGTLP